MRSVAHHVRIAGAAVLLMTACASLRAGGQEVVTALDRNLQKTHMRQEATRVTLSTTPVSAFAPTTIQCGNQTCSVRVEVSSQFFDVTYLKTGLSPGSHSITVEFEMRSQGGTAEAGIRTVMIQVFTP